MKAKVHSFGGCRMLDGMSRLLGKYYIEEGEVKCAGQGIIYMFYVP